MTIEQLAILACGVVVNGLTFALGLAVGASLRKESRNDSSSNEAEAKNWHVAFDKHTEGGAGCRKGGCANPQPEADPAKRPTR
jgi:hypothetical protein